VAIDHKAFASREAFDEALAERVASYNPDVVVLAGFMRILTEKFVRRFEGRILNIHPAILPLFPGLDTHARAIAAGCKTIVSTAGKSLQDQLSTKDFVSPVLDGGAIIGQAIVPVLPSDDPDTLAHRGLALEHKLYPRCVKALVEGRIRLEDGRCVCDDETARELTILGN
jgi:phosphoribosylglycinamide formyltransferase-1